MSTAGRWVALLLSIATTPAAAQTSTTPAIVDTTTPELARVSPQLFENGNLRVSLRCGADWVTPSAGLAVHVDGEPRPAQTVNGTWSTSVDDDGNDSSSWTPSDVGYLLPVGHHHVDIAAPGCAPTTFDTDVDPDHAQRVVGRLAVADGALSGPVGAPNGFGLTLGAIQMPSPRGPQSGNEQETNTFVPGLAASGGFVSFSDESHHFVLGFDQAITKGTLAGTTSAPDVAGVMAFTGSAIDWRSQLRLGARLPLRYVALEAGTGLGIDMWFPNTSFGTAADSTYFAAPGGVDASFFMPMWIGATIKPVCDWGFQVLGQYDVHPFSTDNNGTTLIGGLIFQPSSSCTDSPGVHVSPG